jgi:intracellular sulfur oxidation DsrE/DsrF family protein
METSLKNTRRKFIGTFALGATTGLTAMAAPFTKSTSQLVSGTGDADSWFKKIKGTHRVVFDAAEPNNAFSIIWTWGFYATNNQTGSPDSDITAVCVLRHNAIPFALEDSLWSKYKLGEVFNVTDNRTQKAAIRNPYYNATDGDFPLNGVDGIKKLQDRGAMFCACNLALTVYSGMVAKKMGLDPAAVQKEWVSGVLPGIQIVPAGIWALERAHQHNCAYIFAG